MNSGSAGESPPSAADNSSVSQERPQEPIRRVQVVWPAPDNPPVLVFPAETAAHFSKSLLERLVTVSTAFGQAPIPSTNNLSADKADAFWGMPGGRTAKRSGAAEGREPAGAKPPRGGVLFPLFRSDSWPSGLCPQELDLAPLLRFKKVLKVQGKGLVLIQSFNPSLGEGLRE
jgi:hypothetical protein